MAPITRKTHQALKLMNNSIIDLPVPTNLSVWWNFGSLLAMCLIVQIVTGLFLAMHYTANTSMAFSSIAHICRDVNYGWLLRNLHANGASFFFLCLYLHIARGLYYGSYLLKQTWSIGVIMLLTTMATAFVGYVLPWGQMSLWGATVITNLLSAAPYVGQNLVQWIWGGFSVDSATLTRFFTFHFILPFIIIGMTMLHLLFLHETGSSNPLGLNPNVDKVPFHTYFSFKDILGFFVLLAAISAISTFCPNIMGDPDNFSPADPLMTPPHIKPEWYFLFAYAILRSVPNKLGGVLALTFSILILLLLPIFHLSLQQTLTFRPLAKLVFWTFTANTFLLTWIGGQPVENPFIIIGQITSLTYFMSFIMLFPFADYLENSLSPHWMN